MRHVRHERGIDSNMVVERQLTQLIENIKERRYSLDAEATRLRTPDIINSFDKGNYNCWCLSVMGDSLVRLRLFTEQNFNFVETMGVIALSRYIFELSVWLRLFEKDARYGLVYYHQLIYTQSRYWRDYREQIAREVTLLKSLEQEEKGALEVALSEMKEISDPEQRKKAETTLTQRVAHLVDKKAARHFSIYADQAKTYGYGFQAHLVEKRILPEIEKALADVSAEQQSFLKTVPKPIRELIPKRWNWSQMAKTVQLSEEYDFIYTFSSKLLHATPASITTDKKNLEPQELVVFLKYISVKIEDVVELSREYPRRRA